MEFGWRCTLCDAKESWTSHEAARFAGLRHLFEEHQIGELPLEHPEDHGRRFQTWESQL